jgi:very-short-patch-repair endonuclease
VTAPRVPLPGVLREAEGVVHLQGLLRAGYTRRHVAALHRSGALLRPRIGWYCSPALSSEAVRAIRLGGVLGCVSAATSYGLPVPEGSSDELHVSVAENAGRLRNSMDGERRAAGTETGVHLHWQPRMRLVRGHRVAPLDALLQLADCVPVPWLVAALDGSLHQSRGRGALVAPEELPELRERLPERARAAIDRADGTVESAPETFVRLGLQDAGIGFAMQVPLLGFRVDFLLDGWLVLEVDGAAFHSGPEVFAADRVRDAALARVGLRVLRFSYRQVVDDWPWVLDVIRAVLPAGRPRPS